MQNAPMIPRKEEYSRRVAKDTMSVLFRVFSVANEKLRVLQLFFGLSHKHAIRHRCLKYLKKTEHPLLAGYYEYLTRVSHLPFLNSV